MMDDIPSGSEKTRVPEEPGSPHARAPLSAETPGSGIASDPPHPAAARLDPQKTIVAPASSLLGSDPAPAGGTPRLNADATIVGTRPPSDNGATILVPGPVAQGAVAPAGVALGTLATGVSLRRSPPPGSADAAVSTAILLEIGSVLANRYEILELLGEGGMGAVYKAADRELDRIVALKVIRPEMASNSEILARFKQELILSHQVTHHNVIRIYDLGEAQGIKFITMELVQGRNLQSVLEEKTRLAPEVAVEIARQVCQALEAAHGVGIIHRDLKPQNIMLDSTGRVVVMDFGLARTLRGNGLTQQGAFLGTIEYMSPEQALGTDLDQRSDIFALGLILYELLTGELPFGAENALVSLIKRTKEAAVPVSQVMSTMPGALDAIVSRCLERDLNYRYQAVSEVLADLTNWQSQKSGRRSGKRFRLDLRRWRSRWPEIASLTATLIVLAVGAFWFRAKLFNHAGTSGSTPTAPAVSLAILPFRNASSDASLDWLGSSIADMLTTEVGQSASLRTVSPNIVHQIFGDLRISSSTVLDPATIKRVADFSNADRVVAGQYARFGNSIRIDATLEDIKNNRTVPLKVDVASEKDIPAGIDHLADSIRQTLALPQDVLKELKASSFQPTSTSVDALKNYNQGLGLQRDGKNLEAKKQFEAATSADPNFALAFARLAQTYNILGYDSEAEQSAKKASCSARIFPRPRNIKSPRSSCKSTSTFLKRSAPMRIWPASCPITPT
jgi:eukaryotic-like serine/threonine-protein kinase